MSYEFKPGDIARTVVRVLERHATRPELLRVELLPERYNGDLSSIWVHEGSLTLKEDLW